MSCCIALAVLAVVIAAAALNVRRIFQYYRTIDGPLPSAKPYAAIPYRSDIAPAALPSPHAFDPALSAFLMHACESAVNHRLGADPLLPNNVAVAGWIGDHALVLRIVDSPVLVVAIAGTLAYQDVRDDLQVSQADFYGTRVHSGFADVWAQIYPGVQAVIAREPNSQLIVTGHSLGAAAATLVALSTAADYPTTPLALYASATPRVGDSAFVDLLDRLVVNRWHIVNRSDIVPTLPPAAVTIRGANLQYADFTNVVFLNALGASLGVNHNLSSYLCALGDTCAKGVLSAPPRQVTWPPMLERLALSAEHVCPAPPLAVRRDDPVYRGPLRS